MKAMIALAVASAVTLGGCASDPNVGYNGYTYYDGYRPYPYEAPYYSYGPCYGYPAIGGSFYYRDDDRDHWRGRDDWRDRARDDGRRDNWRGRDRDGRADDDRGRGRGREESRGPVDTRHGEAGNEAGMR